MTARERMRIALACGKPDRIPIAFVTDWDFICKAAGRDLWEYEYGDAATRHQIQREAFLRFPENDFFPCWTGTGEQRGGPCKVVDLDGRPHVQNTQTGELMPIAPRKTAAKWGDGGFGLTSQVGRLDAPRNERDIERILGRPPSVETLLSADRFNSVRASRQELGDAAYLSVGAAGMFGGAIDMMGGFEKGMTALIEQPGLVRTLVEQRALWHCPVVEAGARAGADGAWLGSDGYEGADLISPDLWRKLALPGHRIQVKHAHECGLQVLFWFLGDCMPLLDDLVALGIDGLVLEQGRRGYSSDPVEVRRRVGNAFCVFGWDWELDLIRDNRANITREVERQILGAGADGAFIMSTTYLTAEADLGAVEHYCHEVARMSKEVGY